MKSCFKPFTVKQQTREHQKYFWNTSGKKKKTIRHEKIKPQANVIFVVIDHNTTCILEIGQCKMQTVTCIGNFLFKVEA